MNSERKAAAADGTMSSKELPGRGYAVELVRLGELEVPPDSGAPKVTV